MPAQQLDGRRQKRKSTAQKGAATLRPSVAALILPLAFIAVLAAFTWLPNIQANAMLRASFLGAAAILAAWLAFEWQSARATRRRLQIDISLRPQHYLQALAHISIFVYWGIYWTPIRDAAPLIAAQIVFAYAFDMLLAWRRRDTYTLGFGPFPIIFSTNLFLRFRDDWFYLQFAMVAVGFLAKELIRWNRDGRPTHIFNPSSFPLALFSLGLILTGTTSISWAEEIATFLILPPQIYLFIFLVALPGQFLFRVTTMTLPAVLTTYLFSLGYLKATGTYFFFDSNVPIAVFLGMHLLFTDPSTSPRSVLGRILFGVTYGLSVVGLYVLLGALGLPTFYDKLLQVPLMNLAVKWFDRIAESRPLAWLTPAHLGASLSPRMQSVTYVSLWILVFGAMSAANGVGDRHPGHTIPFWDQACAAGRTNACRNLAVIESRYCGDGSAWSCNELGILNATNRVTVGTAEELFEVACKAGSQAGCANRRTLEFGSREFVHDDPRQNDYYVVLRGGKGALDPMPPAQLFELACDEHWMAGCANLAGMYMQDGPFGQGVPTDKGRAASLWDRACSGGHAPSCSNVGLMYHRGDGVSQDTERGLSYLKKACDLKWPNACEWLAEQQTNRTGG